MRTNPPPTLELKQPDSLTFRRLPTASPLTGLSRSTIYRMLAENKSPPPVNLSSRVIGWYPADLEGSGAKRPGASH